MRCLIHRAGIAGYYLGKYLRQVRTSYRYRRFERSCSDHLRRAKAEADVLLGADFSFGGGVRHHMLAIQAYSRFKAMLIPPDDVLRAIVREDRVRDFQNAVDGMGLDGFRLVHTHADPWIIKACGAPHNRRFAWVHTYHTLYFGAHWRGGLADWQKETNDALIGAAPKADVRISVARWLQTHLEETYGITSVYVPNGVDVARCDAADGARFVARTGLRDFVLFAGSIRDVKNPGDFVRLASALPRMGFVMIGEGLSPAAVVSELGLSVPPNLCVFGQHSHDEVLDAIAACRCFVVTSRNEGLPTVLMEAMALRRPCVAPDLDGSMEAIGDQRYGFVYRHGDFDSLVAQTRAALEDQTVGSQARERVLREYDWRVVIKAIDRIYAEALGFGPAGT